MKTTIRTRALALLCVAAIAAVPAVSAAPATSQLSRSHALIAAALKSIEARFPEAARVSAERVAHAAINGILEEIDPTGSSYVYRAKEAPPQESAPRPGVTVGLVEGVPTIVSVLPHSKAFLAGFSPGDILLKVDDTTVVGKPVNAINRRLEGKDGTKVRLTAYRKSANLFVEKEVDREVFASRAFGQIVGRNIAYLQVNRLDTAGVESLKTVLSGLMQTPPDGFVLDLRSTTGGTVEDAVSAASLFLSDAPVTKIQSQDAGGQERFAPKSAHVTLPLVAICNFGTNGAAEVLASALQDDKRGVVIGETSFGLASTQSSVNLDPENFLQLTTAHYLSPQGRQIWAKGVRPDIAMEADSPEAAEVEAFRTEFSRFCRGLPSTEPTTAETSEVAALPVEGELQTPGEEGGAQPGEEAGETEAPDDEMHEDVDDDGDPGSREPGEQKTSDGVLEGYALVKRLDTQLVRAVNILISAKIFFEYGQQQR